MTKQDYVEARNKLIPEAERVANSIHGYFPTGTDEEKEKWCNCWNLTFHSMMNQLVKERIFAS